MHLIVGGDSIIGRSLSAFWQKCGIHHCASTRRIELVNKYRPYLDLTSLKCADFEKNHYDAIVFCAAVTNLAECEINPQGTSKLNVEATVDLARFFGSRGSYLLLISSNQVFDGQKPQPRISDPVSPITEYGRQKAEAEKHILQINHSAVLRLTKVVHPDMAILKRWNKSLQSGQPIDVFDDMNIAPISLESVVTKIDQMVKIFETGIHHLSSDKDISYYSFAKEYFKSLPNADYLIRKSQSKYSQLTEAKVNSHSTLG